VCFHVFHGSHRFGPFFHDFRQFFVQFFVPADRKKPTFSSRILAILDTWATVKQRLSRVLQSILLVAKPATRPAIAPVA
jgi:hypothetical protein